MAEKYAVGIKSFEMGPVGDDGDMGADLEAMPDTVRGSVQFNTTEPNVSTFHVNNKPRPVAAIVNGDVVESIVYKFYDVSAETLALIFGGEATEEEAGTSGASYASHVEIPQIEQSLRLTTKNDNKVEVVRGLITGWIEWSLNDDGIASVNMKSTILEPTDGTSKAYTITNPTPAA